MLRYKRCEKVPEAKQVHNLHLSFDPGADFLAILDPKLSDAICATFNRFLVFA